MHCLPWEANSGSYFSRVIFQSLPKETPKYHCVALSFSILHTHFRMIILQQLHLQPDGQAESSTHTKTRATR